ncbi:MAG: hypothetical protein HRU13_09945 [Phycisphaerales bacterium]|nr:hypothetical protein [Phycisphaerales bacterium]
MAQRAAQARPTRLRIAVPADFDLARDACSYGYFLLDPYDWDPASSTFSATLALEDGAAHIVLRQSRVGMRLTGSCDRSLSRREVAQARSMIARILRLDESAEDIADFHAVDDRWRFSGRGRLMRSATLFEDMAKTITSCNVQWPGTIDMNAALCARVGSESPSGRFAFPTPEQLARKKATWLRSRCRVGYRDQRLVDLATLFHTDQVDVEWLEDLETPDDEVRRFLLDLPGIGPYAAHNIMQLMGRYGFLPLDTESVRHGKQVLRFDGTDREVLKLVSEHYERFGVGQGGQAFRSYWLDLWMSYETSRGPAHTWDKRTTGRTFTASKLKPAAPRPRSRRSS